MSQSTGQKQRNVVVRKLPVTRLIKKEKENEVESMKENGGQKVAFSKRDTERERLTGKDRRMDRNKSKDN